MKNRDKNKVARRLDFSPSSYSPSSSDLSSMSPSYEQPKAILRSYTTAPCVTPDETVTSYQPSSSRFFVPIPTQCEIENTMAELSSFTEKLMAQMGTFSPTNS